MHSEFLRVFESGWPMCAQRKHGNTKRKQDAKAAANRNRREQERIKPMPTIDKVRCRGGFPFAAVPPKTQLQTKSNPTYFRQRERQISTGQRQRRIDSTSSDHGGAFRPSFDVVNWHSVVTIFGRNFLLTVATVFQRRRRAHLRQTLPCLMIAT